MLWGFCSHVVLRNYSCLNVMSSTWADGAGEFRLFSLITAKYESH